MKLIAKLKKKKLIDDDRCEKTVIIFEIETASTFGDWGKNDAWNRDYPDCEDAKGNIYLEFEGKKFLGLKFKNYKIDISPIK